MRCLGYGLLCLVGLQACAPDAANEPAGESPEVGIEVGALTTGDVVGATYDVRIEYTEEAAPPYSAWQVLYDPADPLSSDAGSAAATLIGPCQANPAGGIYRNRVIMRMLSYTTEDDQGAQTTITDPAVLPPQQIIEFDCTENTDHRVAFEFALITSAEQGFTDITVDLGVNHCAMKVDCQDALETDGQGQRGFTMVTGFACTSGNPDSVVTMVGQVSCYDAALDQTFVFAYDSNSSVDAVNDAITASGFTGLIRVRRYAGEESVADKKFHNTTWRFDEAWLGTTGNFCDFEATGWVTRDAAPMTSFTGYPTVVWSAHVDAATLGSVAGGDPLCGEVNATYGEDPPVATLCDPVGTPFGGGDGSAATPFLICHPNHLQNIGDDEALYAAANFRMAANIDMADLTEGQGAGGDDFSTIGALWNAAFSGVLDNPDGFTIQDFRDTAYTELPGGAGAGENTASGLFAGLSGTVDGLRFVGTTVVTTDGLSGGLALIAVTMANGLVTDIVVDDLTAGHVSGEDDYVCGGIVGNTIAGVILGIEVTLTMGGCDVMGGVLGARTGTAAPTLVNLEDIAVHGTVGDLARPASPTGDVCAGGVGYIAAAGNTVTAMAVDADVTCSSAAGGVAGFAVPGFTISDTQTTGTIVADGTGTGADASHAAGLVALSFSNGPGLTIQRSFSSAAVEAINPANNQANAGGFIATISHSPSSVTVIDSYAIATVTAPRAGGLIAVANDQPIDFTRAWAAPIIAAGCTTCSSTVGSAAGTVTATDSYRFDDTLTGATDLIGAGFTERDTAQAANLANFNGFAAAWQIANIAFNPHNTDMPVLQ